MLPITVWERQTPSKTPFKPWSFIIDRFEDEVLLSVLGERKGLKARFTVRWQDLLAAVRWLDSDTAQSVD